LKSSASSAIVVCLLGACSAGEHRVAEDTDAGDTAPPPATEAGNDGGKPPVDAKTGACAADTRDCADGGVVQCVDGAWVAGERCENERPHCAAGRCIECLRGEVTCRRQTVLLCDENGVFQPGITCGTTLPVCLEGRCVECEPGRGKCDRRQPIQCLADGFYAPQANCGDHTACSFGDCVPDQPPVVAILEPASGSRFRIARQGNRSVDVAVRATVTDAEETVATGRIVWSTDQEKIQPESAWLLNYGTDTYVPLKVSEPCQDTTHQLRLTATDTANNETHAEVTVTIVCFDSP
jgi:hypothetical protein